MRCLFLTLLFAGIFLSSFSQDKRNSEQEDSLKNELLQQQASELKKLEIQRDADSIRRMELQQQLDKLQSTDNRQKEDLQHEIQDLNDREQERLEKQKQKIDSLRAFVSGFPVVPFEDTLFFIYNKIGSFTPAVRATTIAGRIRKLGKDYNFSGDSLKWVQSEQGFDIVYGESIVMSISEADALWQQLSPTQLAVQYRDKIAASVAAYRKSISLIVILKEIGLALLVLLLLAATIYYLGKLFRLTATKIKLQKGKLLKGIKIRNYHLFDARRQVGFLLLINTIVKWLVIILAISLTLPLLFSIFPWTKNFAETLLGYVLTPLKAIGLKVWNYLPNLFTIIVIVVLFHYVIKAIRFFRDEVEKGELKIEGFYPDWANPTFQIIRVLLYAFMIVVIFPYLPGSDSPVFKGVSVFLGILFTFGSAGPLSNLIAGFVITYMRSFKTGDRVKIGEVTGDIISKSLLVTRIRTIKNEVISIPNATVMASHTINFSSEAPEKGLIIHSTVTIGYDVPWRKVHELLIRAAADTEHILSNPPPFVLQTALNDFYVSYEINGYTSEPNRQAAIYSQLHAKIQDEFNKAGVEIMSPHYKAMRDGNQVTIPEENLPPGYTAPSFKVTTKEGGK